ncbi:anti-sigma factor [Effusibacillus consociatus]|uniref:Anti-sigma-W factor RsiW n=1 Tax=Effusibacillus consociatus TaxID=1117041 RepID=A0ABV9Q4F5_9BACL
MNREQENACSLCLSYVFGPLTPEEQKHFETHLAGCADCQREIADLQAVANSLPYTANPVPVPDQLKTRTLQAAFSVKAPADNSGSEIRPKQSAASPISAWQSFVSNRYGKLAAGMLAAVTVAFGMSLWQNNQYQKQLQAEPSNQPGPTTKLERSFPLYTAGNDLEASGIVYLTETSRGIQLVVQVNNAAPLSGEQAYQVWLLRNGQRQNAGTFRVNEKGDGVLVYTASSKPDFDNIGITREPDANGTSPRGPKVMGTKL